MRKEANEFSEEEGNESDEDFVHWTWKQEKGSNAGCCKVDVREKSHVVHKPSDLNYDSL